MPINGSLIVNDVEVCLHAVLRGVGFARLATSLVMSYIENGEMETALDEYADEGSLAHARVGGGKMKK